MALLNPLSPPSPTLKVLHLVGARADNGGILSVLRALQAAEPAENEGPAPAFRPHVWVRNTFVERRKPALDLRRNPAALDEDSSQLRLLWSALRAWPGLARLLREEDFTVVHAHSRGSFPLAVWLNRRTRRRPRRPAVLFTNHTYANRAGMYRAAVRNWGLPTVLLTPNMVRHYGLAGVPNVEIISACASDGYFSRPLTTPPPEPTGRIRFVGVGNLVRWKNWHLLLEAWARLPAGLRTAGRFDLWGPTLEDGEGQRYAAELRAQCEQLKLGDAVQFHGPTNMVAEAVAAADWFVLPSTNEPCSVALIEALALGRPGLVSASGGNVDIVQPGVNGRHFAPDDAVDLSHQLAAILRGERVTAGPADLRASVGHRTGQKVAAQYASLYRRLLRP